MNKFILIIFVCILLVTPIMAEEVSTWDNIKLYDEETKTVTIFNTLGLRNIATIQLDTPLDVRVGAGYRKVAEFTINLFDDSYTDAFGKMEFYDLYNNELKIEKVFDYKYLTIELVEVNDYGEYCDPLNKTGCANVIIGTHKEEIEVWKDFDTKTLLKGNVTIGIFTEVKLNDSVEWVSTLFGKEIDEWASWTGDLLSYWKFDETVGISALDELYVSNFTLVNTPTWVGGLINNAIDLDGINEHGYATISSINTGDWTISVWVNTDDVGANLDGVFTTRPTVNYGYGLWRLSGSNQFLFIWGDASPDDLYYFPAVSTGDWHHYVMRRAGNILSLWFDGSQTGTNYTISNGIVPKTSIYLGRLYVDFAGHYYNGQIDEFGMWDAALDDAQIIQLYNDGDGFPYPFEFVVDPCLCPGAGNDWELNMTEYCSITEDCDLTTGTLNFTGEGWAICDAAINTTNMGDPGNNAVLYLNSSCVITVN